MVAGASKASSLANGSVDIKLADDAQLAHRAVQGHLTALHSQRGALALITLSRDVTSTLPAPSPCPAPLTDVQFTDAAARLGVEVAAIKAVAKVASGLSTAFGKQYRARILLQQFSFVNTQKEHLI